MQSIRVRTSQNVNIDYNIASIGDRLLGFAIDYTIIIAYIIAVSVTFQESFGTWPGSVQVIVFLPAILYSVIQEILFNGQTLGKRAMNTRVVKIDGSRRSIVSYILRWMFQIIDYPLWGSIAIVSIIITNKGQRLGDLAGGTSVVKLSSTRSMASNPVDQPFADDYEPTYNEVFRLNDQEIDLIDKTLAFYKKEGKGAHAEQLAEKLAEKMGVPLDIPPIKFLHTVKKDYLHITSR